METTKRLYRSSTSRVIGGVAGGIAEYFDVDPIIIRMLFVVLIFTGGGVPVYIILWIAIPEQPIMPPNFNMGSGDFSPSGKQGGNETAGSDIPPYNAEPMPPYQGKEDRSTRGALIGGIILITLGSIFLMDKFIPYISFHKLWPLILVVAGAVLIATSLADQKKKNK